MDWAVLRPVSEFPVGASCLTLAYQLHLLIWHLAFGVGAVTRKEGSEFPVAVPAFGVCDHTPRIADIGLSTIACVRIAGVGIICVGIA